MFGELFKWQLGCSYQNHTKVSLCDNNTERVHLDLHQLGEGNHLAAAVIILHCNLKRHQVWVLGAKCGQLVDTCALEVKLLLVKSHIVRITPGLTGAIGYWLALSYAFNHLALLPCSTAFILALHLLASS